MTYRTSDLLRGSNLELWYDKHVLNNEFYDVSCVFLELKIKALGDLDGAPCFEKPASMWFWKLCLKVWSISNPETQLMPTNSSQCLHFIACCSSLWNNISSISILLKQLWNDVESVDPHTNHCHGVKGWSMLKEHRIHVKKFKLHSQLGTITTWRDLFQSISSHCSCDGGLWCMDGAYMMRFFIFIFRWRLSYRISKYVH